MKAFMRLPLTFILAQSILLAFAIGEGYLLHWLLPSIELSTALFLALGASVAVIAIAVFVMTMMMMTRSSMVDAVTEGQNESGKNRDEENEDELEMAEAKEQVKGELNRLLDPHLTEIYRREADRRRRRKR